MKWSFIKHWFAVLPRRSLVGRGWMEIRRCCQEARGQTQAQGHRLPQEGRGHQGLLLSFYLPILKFANSGQTNFNLSCLQKLREEAIKLLKTKIAPFQKVIEGYGYAWTNIRDRTSCWFFFVFCYQPRRLGGEWKYCPHNVSKLLFL